MLKGRRESSFGSEIKGAPLTRFDYGRYKRLTSWANYRGFILPNALTPKTAGELHLFEQGKEFSDWVTYFTDDFVFVSRAGAFLYAHVPSKSSGGEWLTCQHQHDNRVMVYEETSGCGYQTMTRTLYHEVLWFGDDPSNPNQPHAYVVPAHIRKSTWRTPIFGELDCAGHKTPCGKPRSRKYDKHDYPIAFELTFFRGS